VCVSSLNQSLHSACSCLGAGLIPCDGYLLNIVVFMVLYAVDYDWELLHTEVPVVA
jgi:hypothetical protein